jgi:hypothetical protein
MMAVDRYRQNAFGQLEFTALSRQYAELRRRDFTQADIERAAGRDPKGQSDTIFRWLEDLGHPKRKMRYQMPKRDELKHIAKGMNTLLGQAGIGERNSVAQTVATALLMEAIDAGYTFPADLAHRAKGLTSSILSDFLNLVSNASLDSIKRILEAYSQIQLAPFAPIRSESLLQTAGEANRDRKKVKEYLEKYVANPAQLVDQDVDNTLVALERLKERRHLIQEMEVFRQTVRLITDRTNPLRSVRWLAHELGVNASVIHDWLAGRKVLQTWETFARLSRICGDLLSHTTRSARVKEIRLALAA